MERRDGRFEAVGPEPWLAIPELDLGRLAGHFVELTYRLSFWDVPVRPILRFHLLRRRRRRPCVRRSGRRFCGVGRSRAGRRRAPFDQPDKQARPLRLRGGASTPAPMARAPRRGSAPQSQVHAQRRPHAPDRLGAGVGQQSCLGDRRDTAISRPGLVAPMPPGARHGRPRSASLRLARGAACRDGRPRRGLGRRGRCADLREPGGAALHGLARVPHRHLFRGVGYAHHHRRGASRRL